MKYSQQDRSETEPQLANSQLLTSCTRCDLRARPIAVETCDGSAPRKVGDGLIVHASPGDTIIIGSSAWKVSTYCGERAWMGSTMSCITEAYILKWQSTSERSPKRWWLSKSLWEYHSTSSVPSPRWWQERLSLTGSTLIPSETAFCCPVPRAFEPWQRG